MSLKTAFPVMVMAFLLMTGAFFLAAGLVGMPFLKVDASRTPAVTVIAAILIALSFLFYIAWQRGRLEKAGKEPASGSSGRCRQGQGAVHTAQDREDEDEHPKVQQVAAERLKELGEA